ncbi:alcohol dehydrogenase catalytic domain-containing protein [Candidatus Woesearchaeota archaeon]|nr:alcohol dehydrogenase catalytic domain-containing protein [Candidatus Woesearchaeota archaeon]
MSFQGTALRVVAAEKIEQQPLTISRIPENHVLVSPVLAGICQSDLRYYFGRRSPEVLKKKYPLALLHEGVCKVEEATAQFDKGELVVLIPNIPCTVHQGDNCYSCTHGLPENFCQNVRFMSSSVDGMTQSLFVQHSSCLARIPEHVSKECAVLAELLSVSHCALQAQKVKSTDRVIIFGAGPTGYLCANFFSSFYGITKDRLYLADIQKDRLQRAQDFAQTLVIGQDTLPRNVDLAVECVGRHHAAKAIKTAQECLRVQGTLLLLGVSEEPLPIATRPLLEKGIRMVGSTRSGRKDFPPVLELMTDEQFSQRILRILDEKRFTATKEGLTNAFTYADQGRGTKVLLTWT